ncbi:TRAM [Heterostelium album PN500]|uniref:TRAM n=1 Tax=Heterostelium pallidum (strain ATCC 26659 / Pp 5 / PN500) TaxID=670386 RepID=D3B8Y5_HETP5|nr:TRAM [Heterostelium album PN500]EFA82024.1 TRAM [Heterostelium album PN500]|eukprot:XP_020434141.1 TRAM [Heterostelium album PN500]
MNITTSTLELFGLHEASRVINFNYLLQTIMCSMIFFATDNYSRKIAKLFGVSKQYDQLGEKAKIEWNQRTVSMLHAIIVLPLTFKIIYDYHGQDLIYYYNDLIYYTLLISGGYFIWDMKVSFTRPDIVGIPMCIHALVGFFGTQYVNTLHAPNVFAAFTASLLFYEISTIPLNLKGFIQVVNPKSPYYERCLLVFAVSFLFSRCVWGVYVTLEFLYNLYFHYTELPVDKIVVLVGSAILSMCLNLNWGYLLIRKMKQKVTTSKRVNIIAAESPKLVKTN